MYADVLVNFALNSGKGVKKSEVVVLQVPECAKPILYSLRRAVLKAGAYPITEYLPDDYVREFFELANEDQIKFFPQKYLKGKVDQMDHVISIIAETNKYELKGIDPKKIMTRGVAFKPYSDWRNKKEANGKFTWTLGLYGTSQMAKEVNMSLKEYWDEIINGCYLDETNPVLKWKELTRKIDNLKNKLNNLQIKTLHIKAKDTDITIGIGKNRQWLGGSGRNIPSFEVFISPDARVTEGKISFSEPLYRYGNLIKGIELVFKKGKVIKSRAKVGEKILKEMIATKGADMIGEFSLTDSRFSRITKFMGETLYDENVGGKYGNTHIALGMAYKDSYVGNASKIKESEWKKMGFNDSSVHTDIVSTTDRVVTAILEDGSKKVIYKDGKFVI